MSLTLEKPWSSPRRANCRYSCGEFAELGEDLVHAALVDGVEAVGRSGDRGEADFVKAEIVFEVAIDFEDVHGVGGHGDARGDGARVMAGEELADLGLHDVVAAAAVGEDAEVVVHFFRAVDAYGDADAVGGEKVDDLRSEERGVGGQAEIDFYVLARSLFVANSRRRGGAEGNSSAFRRRRR